MAPCLQSQPVVGVINGFRERCGLFISGLAFAISAALNAQDGSDRPEISVLQLKPVWKASC